MDDQELEQRVRTLRAAGRSPKDIARALSLQPAVVTRLVRTIAAEQATAEPAVAGCWVSSGWSKGLEVEGHPDWPGMSHSPPGISGLAGVLVAREHQRGYKRSVCGYLLDVYCLGVKNALGPRVMDRSDLSGFVRRYFEAFDGSAVRAPIELVQQLVWGAVAYAQGLGFEPHPDFHLAAGHLGPSPATSTIHFGRDGKPVYVQGPYDNATSILAKLEASVGKGNFDFIVAA